MSSRVPWGIQVPNDKEQTIYVWLDALVNYYTVLNYPKSDPLKDEIFQNMIHIVGKDIVKFHAIIWPSLLLANKYPPPKQIIVHDFWLLNDVKPNFLN